MSSLPRSLISLLFLWLFQASATPTSRLVVLTPSLVEDRAFVKDVEDGESFTGKMSE